jgi:hypothetical protein
VATGRADHLVAPPREAEIDQPHSVVRVVIEDGSIDGEELVVASERFDVTPWAAGLLIDDLVDAERGLVSQRRISSRGTRCGSTSGRHGRRCTTTR